MPPLISPTFITISKLPPFSYLQQPFLFSQWFLITFYHQYSQKLTFLQSHHSNMLKESLFSILERLSSVMPYNYQSHWRNCQKLISLIIYNPIVNKLNLPQSALRFSSTLSKNYQLFLLTSNHIISQTNP